MPVLCALKKIPKGQGILVAGPTASGKSHLAFLGALQGEGVIVNADSIQVYQGLPLLTATPPLEEQHRVPHKLYGFLPYSYQGFSVAQWYAHAQDSLQDIFYQGQQPWVVGGTGLYLKALERGLSPIPEIPYEFKVRFRKEQEALSFKELHQRLCVIDPPLADKIKDKQRAMHALMVFQATGYPLSYWHTHTPEGSVTSWYKILVWPTMACMIERATQRWHLMISKGALEEVHAFCAQEGWNHAPLSRALGVPELVGVLKGIVSLSEASTLYIQSIRSYIKRQRTWFRHHFSPHLVIPHGL